jgi:hypothetical protein
LKKADLRHRFVHFVSPPYIPHFGHCCGNMRDSLRWEIAYMHDKRVDSLELGGEVTARFHVDPFLLNIKSNWVDYLNFLRGGPIARKETAENSHRIRLIPLVLLKSIICLV